MAVSIIWFIIILSVLVVSHEFGHFLLARVNGIRVLEFSIGMGPTLLHFTKNGTKFCIKLFPIGGSCMYDGEPNAEFSGIDNDKEEGDKTVEVEKRLPFDEGKAPGIPFIQANVWARISCVFAGPFFNFILSFIFAMIIVGCAGSDIPVVQGLTEGRSAIESGIQVGDVITKINGESIHVWRDITLISILNTGEPLSVEYTREGQKGVAEFTPTYSEEDDRYYMGIEGGTTYIECKGLKLFKYGWYELIFNFRNTLKSLKSLVMGKLSVDSLGGPVAIAQVVDESYDAVKDYGVTSVLLTMMNIAMLLSVNLGVVNLLPLPALDGGRLVFLIVEVFRGKPIPPEKEGIVHLVGIILFFILTVFIFYNDIMRIVGA